MRSVVHPEFGEDRAHAVADGFGLRTNAAAISASLRPAASSSRTSRSRWVSPNQSARSARRPSAGFGVAVTSCVGARVGPTTTRLAEGGE